MGQPLRVGIVGAGVIGGFHADAIKSIPDQLDLVAFCDASDSALAEAGAEHGIGADHLHADCGALIADDVDAVFVCVPNFLHKDVVVAAAEAGKHVLCEKPMATSAADAAAMQAAADKAGKVLQIGMTQRFDEGAQVARAMIEAGELGEIYHVRAVHIRRRGVPGLGGWFTTKAKSGGGGLIDVGVHWLDLSMHLGDLWDPTAVSAQTYAKFGVRMGGYVYSSMWAGPPNLDGVCDVDDYASGLVRFARGATLSFEIAWAANAPDSSVVEVLGTAGGLRCLDGEGLTLLTERNGRLADIKLDTANVQGGFGVQAANFAAACRGEADPKTPADHGVTLCKLMEGIYASSEAGREVAV